MLQVFSKQHLIAQTIPALICVLAVYVINKGQGPYYVNEYFSGIFAIYTMFIFLVFGPVGNIVYGALFFWILFKIGARSRTSNLNLYLAGGVLFVVALDLLMLPLVGVSKITAMSSVIQHGFEWYAMGPLGLLALSLSGLVAKEPAIKSLSSIFATTFLLFCTVTI